MGEHIIGGSPFGINDALLDTTDAVLMDTVNVAVVGAMRPTGVETTLGLELGGRVNKSTHRKYQLYLLNADGVAAIISELLGIAGRIDPDFLELILERVRALPKRGDDD